MNRFQRAMLPALVAMLMAAAAGCSILAPQKDQSRFFMLAPVSANGTLGAPAANPANQLAIGVGPVTFPDYLKRPQIVTRVSSDQVRLSQENRWAQPLDSNFQAVLGQNLSQMLSTQRIVMFPWFGTTHLDYQVEVQVIRFDTNTASRAVLSARWIIKDGRNHDVMYATQTTITSPVAADDIAGTAALSRDVTLLSRQITNHIIHLNAASVKNDGSNGLSLR